MVTSVHLLAGAALGAIFKQPILVVPIAFSTHYLLDAVPHYAPKPVKNFKEKGIKGMSFFDMAIKAIEPVLGVILVAMLIQSAPTDLLVPMALGALFGWLPDFFVFLEWKYGINRPWPFRDFEIRTHRHIGGIRGILPQILAAVIAVVIILTTSN